MASHRYLRGLTAPSVVPPVSMPAAIRVKLVFVDELAAFVLRHRGFSSCWYLIPHSARLVGDLLREIADEFELLERCPHGIEIVLDGFHVLANQQIETVRDNDMLFVQCSSFVAETKSSKGKKTKRSTSVERAKEDNERQLKKMKAAHQTDNSGKAKKSAKTVAKTPPADSSSSSDDSDDSSDSDDDTAQLPPPTKRPVKKTVVTTNPASDSSSSDDDKPVSSTPKQRAFKAMIKDTARKMNEEVVSGLACTSPNVSSTSSSSSSSSDTSSDSDSDVAVVKAPVKQSIAKSTTATTAKDKQPRKEGAEAAKGTRRRRRPRRRPRGSDDAETTAAVNAAKPVSKSKPTTLATVAVTPITQQGEPPKEIRPLHVRGVPPPSKQVGKLHVRFDAPHKPAVLPPPAFEREVSSDLQKYGPAPMKPGKKSTDGNGQQTEEEASHAKKKPVKEMWKRPYEIISSMHDETATQNAATAPTSRPTLDALLVSFPSKPSDNSSLPTLSGFQVDDIIAYKTLTLCIETWQPIVSDWKCGKVLRLQDSDNAVVLQRYKWKLPATAEDPLAWEVALPSEDEEAEVSVSISEVTELHYVLGPTWSHLTAPAP